MPVSGRREPVSSLNATDRCEPTPETRSNEGPRGSIACATAGSWRIGDNQTSDSTTCSRAPSGRQRRQDYVERTAGTEALFAEAVGWRCLSMDSSEVIVQQRHVPTRDLDRRWTVAEDALKAEHVATVHQEGPRECMAQDVRRTARLQFRAGRQPMHELI